MRPSRLLPLSCFALAFLPSFGQERAWSFVVAPTWVGGFEDVKNIYMDAVRAKGYRVSETFTLPIGVGFTASREFASGSRLCLDFGPAAYIAVGGDANFSMLDLPLGISYGYAFTPASSTRPYVRIGLRQHLVDGDLVGSTSTGAFAAFGVDFARHRRIGFGVELSVDTSKVTFTYPGHTGGTLSKEAQPGKFMASFKVIF